MTFQTLKNLILAKKASAMLIAMGIAFVLILFGMGAAKVVIRSLREVTNLEHSRYAFSAARAGLNHGLLAAKDNEPGYEISEAITPALANGATANWEIKSRAGQIVDSTGMASTEYYIPLQGWGRAGENCDTVTPEDESNSDSADGACNWDKIRVGESVTIPLYYYDYDEATGTGTIENPVDMGLDLLQVKIRPACKEDTDGDGICDEEYVLNTDLDDTVIVNWEISGECDDTSGNEWTCTMVPLVSDDDLKDSQIKGDEIKNGTPFPNSSVGAPVVLTGGSIESNLGHDVDNPDPAFDKEIFRFITNMRPWNDRVINRPKLKLHFITPLKDTSNKPIPYLEYQVVTDQPIATPYKYVISEGFSGDFKQSLQIRQSLDTTILDFVIQN